MHNQLVQCLIDSGLTELTGKGCFAVADRQYMYRNRRALAGKELRKKQAPQRNSNIRGVKGKDLTVDDIQDVRF